MLEIMDRTTYETIQRLTEAGFLKTEKSFVHQFHCSPAFADSASAERERLRKEAHKVFSEADRKMRMSTLLAEGGFPLEALSPLGQAVELALKASAYSAGEDGAGSEEELSLALIQSRIIPAGSLPENAVAIVASLRESAQKAEGLDEATARDLIKSAGQLIDHVKTHTQMT